MIIFQLIGTKGMGLWIRLFAPPCQPQANVHLRARTSGSPDQAMLHDYYYYYSSEPRRKAHMIMRFGSHACEVSSPYGWLPYGGCEATSHHGWCPSSSLLFQPRKRGGGLESQPFLWKFILPSRTVIKQHVPTFLLLAAIFYQCWTGIY